MTRLGKVLLFGFLALVIIVVGGITLTIGWRPFFGPKARPLTDRRFESTPHRLERGKYLASGCIYCHSQHDWQGSGTPIIAGMEGAGEVEPYTDLPGRIVAPNLTPDKETGAGTWTDDMFARAIREGIGHDGRTLFPLMPYAQYRSMSDEDVASIVVYLRSLPAIKRALPATRVPFPVNRFINAVPQPIMAAIPQPDRRNQAAYGDYLTRLGACRDCHTPTDP